MQQDIRKRCYDDAIAGSRIPMHREVFPQWQTAPAVPVLNAGRIDIWRINLGSAPPSPNSQQAAGTLDRKHSPVQQRDAARRALRDILRRYLDLPPDDLCFCVQPGGKPYLEQTGEPIEFNLSHSRNIALLAVTSTLSVGIDVEAQRDIDDPLRLAQRVMPAEDAAGLALLPAAKRVDRFLDLWTRMEARQKAIGRGIFEQAADPNRLSSFTFRPGQGLYASLSVSPPAPDLELRFFDAERV